MNSTTTPPPGREPAGHHRHRRARRRAAILVLAAIVVSGVAVAVTSMVPSGEASAACSLGTRPVSAGDTGDAVRCVQRALSSHRFPPGPIDGIYGSMTSAAVARFQSAHRLSVTGNVDRRTASALGIWGAPFPCRPPSSVPASARQVLIVNTAGTAARVHLLVKRGGVWQCQRMNMYGRVGRNGIRQLSRRVAGDGTTPAGVYPLATMQAPGGQRFQFFGNGTNPGVHGTWRQVRSGDCWDASGGDAAYNTLTNRSASRCSAPDEYLPNYQNAYAMAALIGANMGPNRSGDAPGEIPRAAAIFLHLHSRNADQTTRPTAGCVSLGQYHLPAVLRALVPGRAYFVIRP